MATARKRWFRVADSILRDLDVEQRGVLVGLMAYLNSRWARDGLSPEDACRAALSRGALRDITGKNYLNPAVRLLQHLSNVVSISVEVRDEIVWIEWPKWSIFQDLPAPRLPRDCPDIALSASASASASKRREDQEAEPPPAATLALDLRGNGAEPVGSPRPKRNPITNLLKPMDAHPPPAPDEIDAWAEAIMPEVEAAADAELPDAATKKQRSGAIKRIALARWRVYLSGKRVYYGNREKRERREREDRSRREIASRPVRPPPPTPTPLEAAQLRAVGELRRKLYRFLTPEEIETEMARVAGDFAPPRPTV